MNPSRIRLKIDPHFQGPTLSEMGSFMEAGKALEVRWEGNRSDMLRLSEGLDMDITLVVKDIQAQERTQTLLGLPYSFNPELKLKAQELISKKSKALEWRKFLGSYGIGVSRGLLSSAVHDACLRGDTVGSLKALSLCWVGGVHPADLDLLLDMESLSE